MFRTSSYRILIVFFLARASFCSVYRPWWPRLAAFHSDNSAALHVGTRWHQMPSSLELNKWGPLRLRGGKLAHKKSSKRRASQEDDDELIVLDKDKASSIEEERNGKLQAGRLRRKSKAVTPSQGNAVTDEITIGKHKSSLGKRKDKKKAKAPHQPQPFLPWVCFLCLPCSLSGACDQPFRAAGSSKPYIFTAASILQSMGPDSHIISRRRCTSWARMRSSCPTSRCSHSSRAKEQTPR